MSTPNRRIEMPIEIGNLWQGFENWRYEVSFSLQGGRGVYKELYDEYGGLNTLSGILGKIVRDEEILVCYRFYCEGLVPMFPVYADGKLSSRVSPRKFIGRQRIEGAYPWEFESDNTVFRIFRFQKNEYFGNSEIRLVTGGFNKENSKENWKTLSREIRKLEEE